MFLCNQTLFYLRCKVLHHIGDLYLLGANRLTALTSNTSGGALAFGQSTNNHRSDESAARHCMLVVKLNYLRYVKLHGTMVRAVATGRTGERGLFYHSVRYSQKGVFFALGQGFSFFKGVDIFLKLLEIRHSR